MPTLLSTTVKHIYDRVPNSVNSKLIEDFHSYMKSNATSERHQNNNLKAIIAYTEFLGPETTFYQISTKEQVTKFLDTKVRSNSEDPDQRWITTWNDYLVRIKHFFRWLNNCKVKLDRSITLSSSEWSTPSFVNIKKKKTKRLSPFGEHEIWEIEDLRTVIKYEPRKRNKAALALLWDLNGRNHEITLLRIKHVRFREKYGEGEIPHQAKTGSGPILLTFSFPYVRDWLNEHPFRNTPDARLICSLNNGAPIKPEALWTLMKQLQARLTGMIKTCEITDETEKERIRVLLNTKRFNPYCLRHSSISHDSDFLPDYALKKKVRWSMNSKQPSRYIKSRMGNDLKQKILVQNGIISNMEGKPKPTVAECSRCNLVNCIENKYCSSCSYPLVPSAFEEIKAAEDIKLKTLKRKYEQDVESIRKQVSSLFMMLEKLQDQKDINVVASTLYKSGQLKIGP
jgi:integrase/recombinase XerD